MPIIEKIITTKDFEIGGIMVETGNFVDNNARMRSINIIPLKGYKTFSVEAKDSSGNPLYFSFVAYGYSSEFITYEGIIDTSWKVSGTTIDLSNLPKVAGIRITLKFEDDITLADLSECKITFSTNTYFTISNSYPYLIGEDKLIEVLNEPYPYIIMNVSKGEYPKYSFLNLIPYIKEPYPIAVPIIKENEYPYYAHLNPIDTGAFCWATNLEKVVIPESCKYIGVTAFRHTKLKEVTIAKDCVYFDTSFPEGCEIKFYP
jgi:hypothetical protein